MIKNQEIKIFANPHDLYENAAIDFMARAIAAVVDKGVFSVVLSGGNTPKIFFDTLAKIDSFKTIIPWQKIQFFFGDERYVSPESSESNYHMAYEHLFSKLPINPENIYRIPTEYSEPSDAAKHYEQTIRKAFNIRDEAIPQFDLVYLGLGDDGHTASLMPFSDIVERYADETSSNKDHQIVASLWVPELNMYRITLTPLVINNSMNIVFLVIGSNKSSAAREVLEGARDPARYPAQLIHCLHGKNIWYLDSITA
jgi:6-phosphogluconolactonase